MCIVHYACNSGVHEEVKIWLYLEDACHRLIQKHLSSYFTHKNITTEGLAVFFYSCESLFLLLRERYKYFRIRCIGQCLELGAGQQEGLHGCICYRNFENFKLNIRINIFKSSPIENVYSHVYFNFWSCSHPGKFVRAWTEERQKLGGRTELHN